jgi:hypothetical protein
VTTTTSAESETNQQQKLVHLLAEWVDEQKSDLLPKIHTDTLRDIAARLLEDSQASSQTEIAFQIKELLPPDDPDKANFAAAGMAKKAHQFLQAAAAELLEPVNQDENLPEDQQLVKQQTYEVLVEAPAPQALTLSPQKTFFEPKAQRVLSLSWESVAKAQCYLVTGSHNASITPTGPDAVGVQPLGITRKTSIALPPTVWQDGNPHRGDDWPATVFRLQVWAYFTTSAPQLVAETTVVLPPNDISCHESTSGNVTLTWRKPLGAEHVILSYQPQLDFARQIQTSECGETQIDAHSNNWFHQPQSGLTYRYALQCVTASGQHSLPVVFQYRASNRPFAKIVDLQATRQGDQVELNWTEPADLREDDDWEIYCSKVLLDTTYASKPLKAEQLQRIIELGKPIIVRENNGVKLADWPTGSVLLYFTPVVVRNDSAVPKYCQIGKSALCQNELTVTDAVLTERVFERGLNFRWQGFNGIEVFCTLQSLNEPPTTDDPLKHIELRDYRLRGNQRFTDAELAPGQEMRLHLRPYHHIENMPEPLRGRITHLDQQPLIRLRYKALLNTTAGELYIMVACWENSDPYDGQISAFLVHNNERLPLHEGDGVALPVHTRPSSEPVTQFNNNAQLIIANPTSEYPQNYWSFIVRGKKGWVRLFLSSRSDNNNAKFVLVEDFDIYSACFLERQ